MYGPMARTWSLVVGPAPGCPGRTETHLLNNATIGFSAEALRLSISTDSDGVVVVVELDLVADRRNAERRLLLPLFEDVVGVAAAPSAGSSAEQGAAAAVARVVIPERLKEVSVVARWVGARS